VSFNIGYSKTKYEKTNENEKMISFNLLLAVILGIAILLFLILYFKIPAFISLLIASIAVGLIAGMEPEAVINSIQQGMGGTLGFVATVVGLGAMFGAILEHSGGAKAIANFMISKMGTERSPLAMLISGFVIAIPVFFDVAFIILVPVIYALQRKTGKSLLLYAIPLLAGLAITHAFIPPTPGPVAVADIIGVELGWVILAGFIVGIPTALVSGLLFGKYIAGKIHVDAPPQIEEDAQPINLPPVRSILTIIAVPIFLILMNTMLKSNMLDLAEDSMVRHIFQLLGHPFAALIIANLLAWYFIGIRRNYSKEKLLDITTKSMAPAGTIILLTGAGGVFKQILVDTGAGKMLAETMTDIGFPLILFAFIAAALIRVIQGSATVAMITAAGFVSPLIVGNEMSGIQLATIVIAIASGASILSHVNDSGFWLIKQYLGIDEKQTFQSWTMMTTVLALTGFLTASLFYLFL